LGTAPLDAASMQPACNSGNASNSTHGFWSSSQAELKEKLATMYDVRDPNTIFVFGFRTQVRRKRDPPMSLEAPYRAAGSCCPVRR